MGFEMTLHIEYKKFGYLLALYDTGKTYKHKRVWMCQCDCGNFREVRADLLNRGMVISCGCQKNWGVKDRIISKQTKRRPKQIFNMSNAQFNKLTALYPVPPDGYVDKWKCECSCGNIIDVSVYKLLDGHTKSCGCKERWRILKMVRARINRSLGVL